MQYLLIGLAILTPFTLIGLLVVIKLFKKYDEIDDSNIFNRGRVFWFSLTRMDKMVKVFPWLRNDEWENMTGERK